MRFRLALTGALFLASATASQATAQAQKQTPIAGSYTVEFEVVQSSCKGAGLSLKTSALTINQARKSRITFKLDALPTMNGKARPRGKFRVQSAVSDAPGERMTRQFTAYGRVKNGTLRLVLIAEYYKDERPLCTESWNGSGRRN